MTTQTTSANPMPKVKRVLPIRTGVLTLLTLFIAGVWFYFAVFFDEHMRWLLQKGLTYANGAEANIASLTANSRDASLIIRGVQMTDDRQPQNNWLQVEQLRFALSWEGLLRARFVVDDASVLGVGLNIPRKKAGFVLPQEKKNEATSKSNAIVDVANDYFKTTAAGTLFEDLVDLKKGFDPKAKLAALRADLNSEKKIKELQEHVNTFEKDWYANRDKIKNDPEYRNIENDVNALKTKKVKTPAEAVAAAQEVEALRKKIEIKTREVQTIVANTQAQLKTIEQEKKALPHVIADDVKALQAQLKLPDIKVEDLSAVIFGPQIKKWLDQGLFYYNKGKDLYARIKSTTPEQARQAKEKAALVGHERRHGRDYEFPMMHRTLPRFYLRKSELSMFEEGQTKTEAIHSTLTDLSSNPALVPQPIKWQLAGNLTAHGIQGIFADAVFDHRSDAFKESFQFGVKEVPLADYVLAQSKEAKIWLAKAHMAVSTQGHITADGLALENTLQLNQAAYRAQAEGKDLERILTGVLAGVSNTKLHTQLGGSWTNLKMSMASDVGKSLQHAVQQQFAAEVANARLEAEKYVDNRIQKERKQLDAKITDLESQVAATHNQYVAQLQNYEKEARQQADNFQNQLKGRAEDELKKKLKSVAIPGLGH